MGYHNNIGNYGYRIYDKIDLVIWSNNFQNNAWKDLKFSHNVKIGTQIQVW